jgi:hypothetical protein
MSVYVLNTHEEILAFQFVEFVMASPAEFVGGWHNASNACCDFPPRRVT